MPSEPSISSPKKEGSARFYRPELDVLRFLAFLLVFFHHGWGDIPLQKSSGFLIGSSGINLFFLLSAYLVTELLDREYVLTKSIRLGAFYARRCLRIWPLYFAVILLDYTIQGFRGPDVFTTSRLVAYFLLAGNWFTAHHGYTLTLSSPLWSISVEEQFYVLWPSARKLFGRRGAMIFSLVVLILSFGSVAYLMAHHASGPELILNSLVLFQFFSSGCLLSLLLREKLPVFHPIMRLALCIAGPALWFASNWSNALAPRHPVLAMSIGLAMVNLGCTAIFLGFLGEARLGASKALVYLGKISYGLYVFHWFCLRLTLQAVKHLHRLVGVFPAAANVLQLAVALALTVLVASLSYRFFEAPILRYKKRFEVVRTREV